jgi:predicted NAD/FAD-binding protein
MSPNNTTMKQKQYVVLAKPHRRSWVRMPKRVQEYVIEQVKAGRTLVALAKELKMNSCSLHHFLKRRGLSVGALKKQRKAIAAAELNTEKPVTAAYEARTRTFRSFTIDNGSYATLNRLAVFLGVEPHEVAKAAIAKFEDLQKQIVRDMLSR